MPLAAQLRKAVLRIDDYAINSSAIDESLQLVLHQMTNDHAIAEEGPKNIHILWVED